MIEFFMEYPWLVAVALTMLVPITAILVAVPMDSWRKVREAELNASLKHAMLERGMSAEEIIAVMNARSKSSPKGVCHHVSSLQTMHGRCQRKEHSPVM